MKDMSYKTAISRKLMSAPLKEIMCKGLIDHNQTVLDFGCGKGKDVQELRESGYMAIGYDPHWCTEGSWALGNKYDVVLCTYVLNVVDKRTRNLIINTLKDLTKEGGKVYITVRRDIKKMKINKNGTCQYAVKLPFKIIKENSSYCIYEMNI